jgi:hypothetical protein
VPSRRAAAVCDADRFAGVTTFAAERGSDLSGCGQCGGEAAVQRASAVSQRHQRFIDN